MALTIDLIKAQPTLTGLSEEQLNALVTLSKNDEKQVIDKEFLTRFSALDEQIKTITGVDKTSNEKTSDYLKRATTSVVDKFKDYDTIKANVDQLTKDKADLEKKLKDNAGDAELKTKYDQAVADLDSAKKQFKALKDANEQQQKDFDAKMFNFKVDNIIAAAMGGLKFKQGLAKETTDALTQVAIQHVKAMKPEFVDDGKGGKTLVFKNEDGTTRTNPDNGLNPFTAAELITKELKVFNVLDEGRRQAGSGTKPTMTKGADGKFSIDLSGCTTKVEADEAIQKAMAEQGIAQTDPSYMETYMQIRNDNNVESLPEH